MALLYTSSLVPAGLAIPRAAVERIHLSVALLSLGLFVWALLASWVSWYFTHLLISDDHLVYSTGVLNRKVAKVPVQEIASIDLHQTLFQRMIGSGDLVVDMRGASLLTMRMLKRPQDIQNRVLAMRYSSADVARQM